MQKKNEDEVLVVVFNLRLNEEIELALNKEVTLISSLNGIEYFVNATVNVLKECFQN